MKIERITDKKIKVTLTSLDLKSFDIDLNSVAFSPEKVEEIFKNMLRIAEIEEGFVTYDSQLMIEAKPSFGQSNELIMYITKLDDEQRLAEMHKLLKSGKLKARKKAISDAFVESVYNFSEFEDIVSCLKNKHEISFLKSSLVKYNGNYYLIVLVDKSCEIPLDVLLCEYSQKIKSKNYSAFLREHGEILIEEEAAQKIARFF